MTVVDASVWIGSLLDDDAHHDPSVRWLSRQLLRENCTLFAPSLLVPEVVGAIARRTGNRALARSVLQGLLDFSALELLPLDPEMAVTAARLAADLRLRGADACYVAVAQALDLPLVTWDEELRERTGQAVTVVEPE